MKMMVGICGRRVFLAMAQVGVLFSACALAQNGSTPDWTPAAPGWKQKVPSKTATGIVMEGTMTPEEFERRAFFNALQPDEVVIMDGRDHEEQSPDVRLRNAHDGFSVVDVIFSGAKFPDLGLDDRQKSLVEKLVAERLLGRAADHVELRKLLEKIDREGGSSELASFFREVRSREQSREEKLANGFLEVLLPKQYESIAKQLLGRGYVRGLGNEIVAIQLGIDGRTQVNIQAAIVARQAALRRVVLGRGKQYTSTQPLAEDKRDDLDLPVLRHLSLDQLGEYLKLTSRIEPSQAVQDYVEEMSSSRQQRYARIWPDLRKVER